MVRFKKNSEFIEPDIHTDVNYNKVNWVGFSAFIEETITLSHMLEVEKGNSPNNCTDSE